MARKDCLPSARAGKHASGDPIRFFGGDARSGRWRGARSWIRNRLLVGGQTSGSHGRDWPASAVSSRVGTRHHFLFPRSVLFLKNADVEMKLPNGQRLGEYLARRRLQVLLQIGSNRFLSLLTLLFLCLLFFNYYLSCRQTRNGHAEQRSTDVVHADLMAKLHAVGIAAMFAADADLEFGARLAPLFDAPAHQHADTLGIE